MVVSAWYELPRETVESPLLETFKEQLADPWAAPLYVILLGAGHLAQVDSRDALNQSEIQGGKRSALKAHEQNWNLVWEAKFPGAAEAEDASVLQEQEHD